MWQNFPIVAQKVGKGVFLFKVTQILKQPTKRGQKYLGYFEWKFDTRNFLKTSNLIFVVTEH